MRDDAGPVMDLTFGDALAKCGLARSDVRLLRHQAKSPLGRTPYLLWRDQRTAFDEYQSVQSDTNRAKLAAPLWASFVVPANGGTLFSGLYLAERIGPAVSDWVDPLYERPGSELTTSQLDRYRVTPSPLLASYVGKLWIEWGAGTRSWIQRADNQDKAIVQLTREFREDAFPGYDRFIANVSDVATLPLGWAEALRAARGVYLLTSARTKEQYVGSATGDGGFYARWLNYASDGHGGNIGLKSADPSDYQIAILECAGSAASYEQVLLLESLWKRKLQSRELGLNRN